MGTGVIGSIVSHPVMVLFAVDLQPSQLAYLYLRVFRATLDRYSDISFIALTIFDQAGILFKKFKDTSSVKKR